MILNVGSGQPRRIGDILDELLRLAGLRTDVTTDTARLRPPEIVMASCDTARAWRLLGWAPVIPWAQTLADVLDDWRTRTAREPAPTGL